jgi:RNA polymerase sigma-70 factor (ECF subfamily)
MTLDRWMRAGRAAWPELSVDEEPLLAWLEERVGDAASETSRAGDLYLAFACSRGDAGAIRAFEEAYFADLFMVLKNVGALELSDEIRQVLRLKLFFPRNEGGVDAEPAIVEYSGRGALRAWFRVVTARIAVDLKRRASKEVALPDESSPSVLASADPEFLHLQQRYRTDFVAAFCDAVAELSVKERNLLRQYYVEHLTIDRIGAMHRIHRATAARWMQKVRDGLLQRTRGLLRERLDLTPSELDSLLRLFENTVDVDLPEFLEAKSAKPFA